MKLLIGLMSGTSMDGIDAVLMDGSTNALIHGFTHPYSDKIKQMLQETLANPTNTLAYYSQLHTLLGREFVKASLYLLKKTNKRAADIVAIGSHGQTLCHNPSAEIPYTVQLGCPHSIAELTGITVVADFRTRDLVLGGQGAPLAPLYHQALFQDRARPIAVINIGGIANITYLAEHELVFGYDPGPGNCLMDAWILKHKHQCFDKSGDWAKEGRVIDPLLNDLLEDAYFKRPKPKSAAREYFSLAWLEPFLKECYQAVDVQATLLRLTATVIVKSVLDLPKRPEQVYLCGGGVHNTTLFQAIAELLPGISVLSTEVLGVSPDYLEALMIAWLADKALQGLPCNLQNITGAKTSAILGVIYPPGIDKSISYAV